MSISLVFMILSLSSAVANAQAPSPPLEPTIENNDATRPVIRVRLTPVASGFSKITDLIPFPGDADVLLVLEKGGSLKAFSFKSQQSRGLLKLEVDSFSEMGLLGIAFHPAYPATEKIYLHYNPKEGARRTRISEWALRGSGVGGLKVENERVLLEVPQPYGNHKGGQLRFGSDGYLYIGLGDGGSQGDPQGNAQNPNSLLGKILRLDVNRAAGNQPYSVPPDNPFVGRAGHRPEIWALGLRNPWRFSWAPGHEALLVADVGQDAWEEISWVVKGGNYGWNIREGRHCYKPPTGCSTRGLLEPIYEYSHSEGQSIIGGTVYDGSKIAGLSGKYVFGDYVSGRLWAIEAQARFVTGPQAPAWTLGRFDANPTTFARRPDGELLVADYGEGVIYLLEAGSAPGR